MIADNVTLSGIIAIIIAYLLGSIPSAYIVTRLIKGKDIRTLGSGNVGGHNVFREVGWGAAVFVSTFDIGKGAAAAYLAYWLLGKPALVSFGTPQLLLAAAGIAVIAGHMWSVYLKFTGGNGIATTIGALAILMPRELLIALALTVVLLVITRNPVLSANISLLSVPVSGWFFKHDWLPVIFAITIALMLVLHFIPTARAAMAKAGTKEKLTAELLRRDKAEDEQ